MKYWVTFGSLIVVLVFAVRHFGVDGIAIPFALFVLMPYDTRKIQAVTYVGRPGTFDDV